MRGHHRLFISNFILQTIIISFATEWVNMVKQNIGKNDTHVIHRILIGTNATSLCETSLEPISQWSHAFLTSVQGIHVCSLRSRHVWINVWWRVREHHKHRYLTNLNKSDGRAVQRKRPKLQVHSNGCACYGSSRELFWRGYWQRHFWLCYRTFLPM